MTETYATRKNRCGTTALLTLPMLAALTLVEVRTVIAARELTGPPCVHVSALLDAHAADLDQRIAELDVLRDEVNRLRERARGLDPAACTAGGVCHVILTLGQHDLPPGPALADPRCGRLEDQRRS